MGISFSAFVFLVLLTSESSVFRHCLGLFLVVVVVVVVVVEFGGSLGFLGFLGSVRPATAERRGGGVRGSSGSRFGFRGSVVQCKV